MVYSDTSPVTFSDVLPDEVDVVIIGGGIIGVSTAWFLAKSGVSVLICEKGRVAGEQSSRNWGWVRQQGRDEAELPIMMESIEIWKDLQRETQGEVGFEQNGVMYIGESDDDIAAHENWVKLAAKYNLKSTLLRPQDVKNKIPALQGEWLGAVFTASDGRAEPFKAVPAIARGCQQMGVKVIENCAARSLSTTAGQVSSVITEIGEVRCQSVVCAGGAWSSTFLANLGCRFPQLTVKSTVVRTAKIDDFYAGNASCKGLALRRRQDGGYTIAPSGFSEHQINADSFRFLKEYLPTAINYRKEMKLGLPKDTPGGLGLNKRWREDEKTPFEKQRVLNPLPSAKIIQMLKSRFQKRLPAMQDVQFVESWAGMIDATPDVVPVMDQITAIPGLFLASGFSGHGFGIGPAAGKLMANMVLGNDCQYDLSRFRFSRFSDGSVLKPGPSI